MDWGMLLLAVWLIESFILFTMIAFFVVGYYDFKSVPTMPTSMDFSTTNTSYLEYASKPHKRLVNYYEGCFQSTRNKFRSTLGHNLLCAHGFHSIHEVVNHAVILVSEFVRKTYQSISGRAAQQIEQEYEGDGEDLSNLHLGGEYHLPIPTTQTEGILDTATLHNANALLLALSVQYCHLKPGQRCAAIGRIAQEIMGYSDDMGHVWSMENTFTQAARLLQYQSDADWFERLLGFRTMEHGSISRDQELDIMARFIAMVFFLTCGLPTSGRMAATITSSRKEQTYETDCQLGVNTVHHTSDASASYVKRTRSSSRSECTRQRHTLLHE